MSLLMATYLFYLYVILAFYGHPQLFSSTTYTPYTFQSYCSYVYFYNTRTPCNKDLFPSLAPGVLSITFGSSWIQVEWSAQSATCRVLYRESGAPDYQVIVPTTSQLYHNITALQPNTLYNIVVEATLTVTQQKFNSSVTTAYTTPHGELEGVHTKISVYMSYLRMSLIVPSHVVFYRANNFSTMLKKVFCIFLQG